MSAQVMQTNIAKAQAAINTKNQQLQALLDSLQTKADRLSDTSLTHKARFEIVAECQFLLVKLRTQVLNEMFIVKEILTRGIDNYLRPVYSVRDTFLTNFNLRITEVREDISATSRILYGLNYNPLK